MTALPSHRIGLPRHRASLTGRVAVASPWTVVGQGAAAMAAGMGVGRFVYTPILPLMHAQAGLSSQLGASLATANYIGYLIGALAGTLVPALVRSAAVLRGSLVVLIATLALMPATREGADWFTLRLVAGAASALIFVIAVSALLSHLRGHGRRLTGWAFGGIGAGIAASGLLVLVLRSESTWRAAWWASAALTALFTIAAWPLKPEPAPKPGAAAAPAGPEAEPEAGPDATPEPEAEGTHPAVRPQAYPRTHRWFAALFVSYSLEGVGYIIAGTFLVAAIEQGTPGWIGSAAWVLVGVAAIPSAALWARLGHRYAQPTLLFAALAVQAVGIALPALVGGVAAALLSDVLFGATFLGVATLALSMGAHLRFPRAVALLTAGYSLGQILGPLVVAPLIHHGYHQALLLGALVVSAAALAAAVLRVRYPHRLGEPPHGTG